MSGTYTYAPIADEVLTEAWERLGKAPDVMTADVVRSARRSLQLMLTHWTNIGLQLWMVEPVVVQVGAGVPSITLSPEIVDIIDAFVTTGGYDRILSPLGRSDYLMISDKTVQATPSQYWVQRVLPTAIVTLYPVPNVPVSITMHCLRLPQDVTSMAGKQDVPVLYSEALAAGLASRLAMKFAPDRVEVLEGQAEKAFAAAYGEDRERAPLKILPRIW